MLAKKYAKSLKPDGKSAFDGKVTVLMLVPSKLAAKQGLRLTSHHEDCGLTATG